MSNEEKLKIIKALADGVDPFTGEELSREHICQRGDVRQALINAAKLVEQQIEINSPKSVRTLELNEFEMGKRDEIAQLETLLSDETDEKLIVETGGKLLADLKFYRKSHKSEFSEGDVEILRKSRKYIHALEEFILEQDDFPYLSSKEEVDATVSRLSTILEQVAGSKVSLRVEKEIRELIEKKPTLPSRIETQKEKAISTLNSNAPVCKKCSSKMVVREGNGDLFWGCSTYPKCWGTKQLTKEELNLLPD